jgi:hypothetical protein
MPLSDFDRKNIGYLIKGHGSWFTARMLRMIRSADPTNRARLRLVYPEEVALVEQWELENAEALAARRCAVCGQPGTLQEHVEQLLHKAGEEPGSGAPTNSKLAVSRLLESTAATNLKEAVKKVYQWQYEDSPRDFFARRLFNLWMESDPENQLRLAWGFPLECQAIARWHDSPDPKEFFRSWGFDPPL